jgi:hypothetical protein
MSDVCVNESLCSLFQTAAIFWPAPMVRRASLTRHRYLRHSWAGCTGHFSPLEQKQAAVALQLDCWLKPLHLLSRHHLPLSTPLPSSLPSHFLRRRRRPVQTTLSTIPCLTDNCENCVVPRRDMKKLSIPFSSVLFAAFRHLGRIPQGNFGVSKSKDEAGWHERAFKGGFALQQHGIGLERQVSRRRSGFFFSST